MKFKNQKVEEKDPKIQARTYSCRFLRAGPVQYDNEVIAIYPENLMKIAEAFKGYAVIINHKDLDSGNADDLVVGYISDVWKNDQDEWAWCNFLVDNKEAIDLIDNGCFVSCAYIPTDTKQGGTYNNIEYQREIVGGKPLHLALVESPRYEGANIIKNSKEEKTMFRLFRNSKEEIKNLDSQNTVIEIDGEEVPLQNAIEAFKNVKAKKNKAKMNEDDEVEIDGEMVKVADLKKAYSAGKKNTKKNADEDKEDEKENEADDEDVENEADDKEEKENEGDEKSDKKDEKAAFKKNGSVVTDPLAKMKPSEKMDFIQKQQKEIGKNLDYILDKYKNSKEDLSTEDFKALKNAKSKYEANKKYLENSNTRPIYQTRKERLERGEKLYGVKK